MSSKRWRISLIKATPAAIVGYVDAPDDETAIAKAIEEFKITGERRSWTKAIRTTEREARRLPSNGLSRTPQPPLAIFSEAG
jgi:hypothetical protein